MDSRDAMKSLRESVESDIRKLTTAEIGVSPRFHGEIRQRLTWETSEWLR